MVGEPEVQIDFDAEKNTLTISDSGIGMTRDEVISNLGTIAKSGTAQFLESLTGDQKKDSQLIGQFGVGFYSAFIVADEVEVLTRKAGTPEDEATLWVSKGEADYSIDEATKATAGTQITLHLKDEEKEYAESFRLRSIVKKYADHISIPVSDGERELRRLKSLMMLKTLRKWGETHRERIRSSKPGEGPMDTLAKRCKKRRI